MHMPIHSYEFILSSFKLYICVGKHELHKIDNRVVNSATHGEKLLQFYWQKTVGMKNV